MTDDAKRFDRTFEPYRTETAKLEPWAIRIDPGWNPRDMDSAETREHIEALKESILLRGILDPVRVKYDPHAQIATLVTGQCRVTAARELWNEGHQVYVPAVRALGDEAELTAQNLVSNSGAPLRQDEIGVSAKRLFNWGWSLERIAATIAKPVRYVSDAIALADAPLEAKHMIASGDVTAARVLQEIGEFGENGAVARLKSAVASDHKNRPLPRRKAPSTTLKALAAADQLASYIRDNHDLSFEKLQKLAGEFLSLRASGAEGNPEP